jgi:hypothetical protein
MCDEQVFNTQKGLQTHETRVPEITEKRAEEVFPSVKESLVCILCLCRGKGFYYLVHYIDTAKKLITFYLTYLKFYKKSCTH